MASATISTPRTKRLGTRRTGGFSLVEVIVASTLSVLVLAGVMTAFLMIGRSGYNAANYSMMEAEARRALEVFSQDARMAKNITWHTEKSVTLTVVTSTGTQDVTYTYDDTVTSPLSSTYKTFYRKVGAGTPRILVYNVADFSFRRYKVVNGVDFSAINDLETKQLQITLRAVRTGATTVDATNAVLSARVVLRNKVVST